MDAQASLCYTGDSIICWKRCVIKFALSHHQDQNINLLNYIGMTVGQLLEKNSRKASLLEESCLREHPSKKKHSLCFYDKGTLPMYKFLITRSCSCKVIKCVHNDIHLCVLK